MFLKYTLSLLINFAPLIPFPLSFFILEHTKTINLFTQVLTINKHRSTAKILPGQNKICQETNEKVNMRLSKKS
jgi:hypothetical protein